MRNITNFIMAVLINFGILSAFPQETKLLPIKTDTPHTIVVKSDTIKQLPYVPVPVSSPIDWTEIIKGLISVCGGLIATILMNMLKTRYPGTFKNFSDFKKK